MNTNTSKAIFRAARIAIAILIAMSFVGIASAKKNKNKNKGKRQWHAKQCDKATAQLRHSKAQRDKANAFRKRAKRQYEQCRSNRKSRRKYKGCQPQKVQFTVADNQVLNAKNAVQAAETNKARACR